MRKLWSDFSNIVFYKLPRQKKNSSVSETENQIHSEVCNLTTCYKLKWASFQDLKSKSPRANPETFSRNSREFLILIIITEVKKNFKQRDRLFVGSIQWLSAYPATFLIIMYCKTGIEDRLRNRNSDPMLIPMPNFYGTRRGNSEFVRWLKVLLRTGSAQLFIQRCWSLWFNYIRLSKVWRSQVIPNLSNVKMTKIFFWKREDLSKIWPKNPFNFKWKP